jgi:hypothetical protein
MIFSYYYGHFKSMTDTFILVYKKSLQILILKIKYCHSECSEALDFVQDSKYILHFIQDDNSIALCLFSNLEFRI